MIKKYTKIAEAIRNLKNALEMDEVKNAVEFMLDEIALAFESDPNFNETELRNAVYKKREVLSAKTLSKIKSTQKLLK